MYNTSIQNTQTESLTRCFWKQMNHLSPSAVNIIIPSLWQKWVAIISETRQTGTGPSRLNCGIRYPMRSDTIKTVPFGSGSVFLTEKTHRQIQKRYTVKAGMSLMPAFVVHPVSFCRQQNSYCKPIISIYLPANEYCPRKNVNPACMSHTGGERER